MEDLTIFLEALAEKLGTTGEHLWKVLINQAKISAITDLIWLSIYIPLFIIGTLIIIKKWTIWYNLCSEEAQVPFVVFVGTLAFSSVIMLIVTLCGIPNIVNGFFNPEYWALDNVVSHIAKLKIK